MRHAGNLLADNGGQLLSLLKPFMSWISSASSLARPSPTLCWLQHPSRHTRSRHVQSWGKRTTERLCFPIANF